MAKQARTSAEKHGTAAKTRAGATRARRVKKPETGGEVAFAIEVARLLADDKCTDVVLLDLRGLSQVTDFLVIGSGTSDRQMHAVMQHVGELGDRLGHRLLRTNADERSTWLLADFVDVIVHLFEPNTRAHYDLEMLWGDAKRPAWERDGQAVRNRAGLTAGDSAFNA